MQLARPSHASLAHGSSATSLAAYEAQGGSRDPGDLEVGSLRGILFISSPVTCRRATYLWHIYQTMLQRTRLVNTLASLEKLHPFVFTSPENPYSNMVQIKIMWPRGDVREALDTSSRRTKSSGLSGFVSFKRRKDAEAALRELDGAAWAGSTLRVGWSKAVPTSGKVLYGSSKNHKSYSNGLYHYR